MKRFSYVYEIPLFYALVCAINFVLWPRLPGFVGIEPHPYWIGVLIFGFRYGVLAGFISGATATLLYLSLCWSLVERYLFEDFEFYLLPGTFIIVGVLIGKGIERYRSKINELQHNLDTLERHSQIQAEEVKTLSEINRGLEKKIVTKMSTIITLYEGARKMESTDSIELYQSILDFIAKTLDAEQSALYLKEGVAGLRLWGQRGWKEYEKRPEYYDLNQGIVGLSGVQGTIISVRDFLQDPERFPQSSALLGDCLMAGPIRCGEDGPIVGVMAIQKMAMLNFNSSSVSLFQFLLNWASRSVGRADYIRELQASEIIDPEYQIYSQAYFMNRAESELTRSKTYYLPLTLGLAQIDGLEGLSTKLKSYTLTAVSQVIKSSLRSMDVVARYHEANIPFSILLITASENQARQIEAKILENYARLSEDSTDNRLKKIKLSLGFAAYSPQITKLDELVNHARAQLSP